MKTLFPPRLTAGDTIGVFTPSSPSHVQFKERYQHGLENLRAAGFNVLEGMLTAQATTQGYRSGTPVERAEEFMALVRNPQVKAMMSVIGGYNSSSMIPYLDFEEIRANPKIICGYSDVTSLHMAIYTQSSLSTFYGPAVVPSFGEWQGVIPETVKSFLDATLVHTQGPRQLTPPSKWSNQCGNWATDEWKTTPREWQENEGWKALHEGNTEAPILLVNLNTAGSLLGTPYFPDVSGKVLLIENSFTSLMAEERSLMQFKLAGLFDNLAGLIIGKPERLEAMGAPFDYEELLYELLGDKFNYPVIWNFDCGHTHPMLTIAQGTLVRFSARKDEVDLTALAPMVS